MAEWRHIVQTLSLGTVLGDIVLDQLNGPDVLNGAGAWSARAVATPDSIDILRTIRETPCMVVSLRDRQVAAAGIAWGARYEAGSGTLDMAGAGLWSYLDHRLITTDFEATASSPAIIGLAVNLHGIPSGIDFQIVSSSTSGRTWERTVNDYDGKTLGSFVKDFTGVLNGPDVRVHVRRDGDDLTPVIHIGDPRIGRPWDDETSPVFDAGVNVFGAVVGTDLSAVATDVRSFGTDEVKGLNADGDEIYGPIYEDRQSSPYVPDIADHPRLDVALDHRSVVRPVTLRQHGDGYLADHATADHQPFDAQVLPDHPGVEWWTWNVGDDCVIRLAPNDPLLPSAVVERRILGCSWSLDGLTVTFGRRGVT